MAWGSYCKSNDGIQIVHESKMKKIVTSLLFVLLADSLGFAQQRESSKEALLERKLVLQRPGPKSVKAAFAEALGGADAPGGMELVICGTAPSAYVKEGVDLKSALEEILAAKQHTLAVEVTPAGVINLRERSQAVPLLDVRVSEVTFPDISKFGSARSVLLPLLQSAEVQSAMRGLQLRAVQDPSGLESALPPGARRPPPITLRDVTVREALNFVARLKGSSVWVYEEQRCQVPGKAVFSIQFLRG